MQNPTSNRPTVKTCPAWCDQTWHTHPGDVDHYSAPAVVTLHHHQDDGEFGGLGLMIRQGSDGPQLLLAPPEGGPATVLNPAEAIALITALSTALGTVLPATPAHPALLNHAHGS